jgi:glycerol-3-phosphate dehydrogenase (NAD(P)+)
MSTIAVIGSGSWGAAISIAVARSATRVLLWGRTSSSIERLAQTRTHPQLGAARLPEQVEPTCSSADLKTADLILWAVPTQHTRAIAKRLAPSFSRQTPLFSLSKGLEEKTLARVSQVLAEETGAAHIGCLSGPSHASEVASGLPCCLVAAGAAELCGRLLELLHGQGVRLYTSTDVLGVELGGALKNVIAIAAGITEGLGFGDNTKAAIITRGLAEIRRLGRAMGANDATFAGMAGVGDLLTTCYSPQGRNRALGLAIARGENPLEILHRSHTVAEGAWTSRAAIALGRTYRVELPIASQVASVIWDATPVPRAMELLLARAPKEEDA